MRAVLIDNATLTAVQRLTGEASTRSKDTADGDIVALESLLQALLLYDVVLCLDDYKPQFRESRRQAFPFIGWVDVKGSTFVNALEKSKGLASDIRPKIKAGKFADPVFSELIERLKLNMAFAWDMNASEYYLQFRMLGAYGDAFDRYSTEVRAIFSEIGDSQHSYSPPSPQLVDRFGKEVPPGEMTSATKTFISALSWLALNTIYYGECSRILKCDLLLHPIRHEFHILHASRSGDLDAPHKKLLLSKLERQSLNAVESVWSGVVCPHWVVHSKLETR